MLRAVHSNRVEALFDALDEALPPADPFTPSTVVVGSRVVARWLTLALARSRGIAAGFDLVTFDDFIATTWATDGLQPLDRHRLAAALASVLADDTIIRTLPAVSHYLSAAPAHGDRAGPRRVQLAEHLASLAWSYALTRPDWMPALLVGRVPSELADDRSAAWQAALLGAAMSRLANGTEQHEGILARWAPTPMLPWLRRRAQLPPPTPRGPVSVFGMSFFARSQLEALTDLSQTADVTIYMLDPCEELWDDVAGRASRASTIDTRASTTDTRASTTDMRAATTDTRAATTDTRAPTTDTRAATTDTLAATTDTLAATTDTRASESAFESAPGSESASEPTSESAPATAPAPASASESAFESEPGSESTSESAPAPAPAPASAPASASASEPAPEYEPGSESASEPAFEPESEADEPTSSRDANRDPLPLVLWGKPVRDTIAALIERTSGDIEGRFVANESSMFDVIGSRGDDAATDVDNLNSPTFLDEPRARIDHDARLTRRNRGGSNGGSNAGDATDVDSPSTDVDNLNSPISAARPSTDVDSLKLPISAARPSTDVDNLSSPMSAADVDNLKSPISAARPSTDVDNLSSPMSATDVDNLNSPMSAAHSSSDRDNLNSPISAAHASSDRDNLNSPISAARPSTDVDNLNSPISAAHPATDVDNLNSPISAARPSTDVDHLNSPMSAPREATDLDNLNSPISAARRSTDLDNLNSPISARRLSTDIDNLNSPISATRLSTDVDRLNSPISAARPATEDARLISAVNRTSNREDAVADERAMGPGAMRASFSEMPAMSARELLLEDMRARRGPTMTATDAGITVLACPNVRREIEVIASEVRRRLDADVSLTAHEVAVWIAGEAEPYLAQAPSAFEAVGVPCHLIDAPIDDRGRIGEAVLALLELPTSTMTRRELLRVMTHPAVLAAHPHVDAADWVRWTERLGIVHGADASAHQGTYLEEYPAHFHWDQGVRRLALGAFMVGERAGVEREASVAIGGVTCAPEEVRPDQQASAATYALIVRSLCADAAWLGQHEATLTEWGEIFVQLVGAYLAARDEEAKRDIERARTLLAGIAKLDVDGRKVGFREARVHAGRRLGAARANRGEMLANGVMIAPLAAMRAIPFRVGFVAGLDEGAFPAGEQTSPLDLRTTPRAGDVSPRDRDRAAFLDVLLCTREALVLSYVAVEAKSGQPLGPSSVVLELADALAPYLGSASSREALAAMTVRHPLHRFGARDGVLPAIARERWACEVRDALRAHLRTGGYAVPDEDGTLSLLAHPGQRQLREALGIEDAPHVVRATAGAITISIANLRKFLEHPIQAWAQSVLGLDELPDGEVIENSDEPFHLDSARRAGLLRDVLAAQLRDPSRPMAEVYDALVATMQLRGQFPVGVFASAARTRDLMLLQTWRAGLGPVVVAGATRYGFGRAQAAGTELLPALTIELPGRVVRLVGQTELLLRAGEKRTSVIASLSHVEKKSPYHLRGAIDHVVLAAAGIATAGHAHKLLDPEGKVFTVEHGAWTAADARAYLATILVELLEQPHGYLLPFDGLVKALAGSKQSRQYGDPTSGLGYGPIERRDGLVPPAEANAIAQRRLAPLVEKMLGDHGFERSQR